jgi:hypothetical protein
MWPIPDDSLQCAELLSEVDFYQFPTELVDALKKRLYYIEIHQTIQKLKLVRLQNTKMNYMTRTVKLK